MTSLELDAAADRRRATAAQSARVRRLLLGVEQVEHPLRAGHPGLQRVVHAGDLGQRLVELADVLDERLDAAERDLARRDLDAADHRHRDVAEVADERRRRRHQTRKELRPKAGVVDVVVELAELLLRAWPGDRRS